MKNVRIYYFQKTTHQRIKVMSNKYTAKVRWNGNHLFSGQEIEGEYYFDNVENEHIIIYTEIDYLGNVLRNGEHVPVFVDSLVECKPTPKESTK